MRFLIIASLAAILACQQEPLVPRVEEGPVTLTVSTADSTVRIGQPDTITVTIANSLDVTARLTYETNCVLTVTIRNQRNQVVLGEDFDECIRVPTTLSIPAMSSIVRRFVWTGGSEFVPPDTPAKLPPGPYFISASINAVNYTTYSAAIRVDLSR
ncbi:MAG: hypothetical protein ACT4OZ_15760 [Gemmatimonadota bacterium]